jgi:acyl carrier protein
MNRDPDLQDVYPLTPMQSGILFHVVRAPELTSYVEQFVLETDGPLDTHRIVAAWNEVIGRHPLLRTAFVWEGVDSPVQVVMAECRIRTSEVDLTDQAPDQVDGWLTEFLGKDRERGVSISEAPLMRLTVLRHDRGCVLVWTLHHLVMDGWSMAIVLDEVATCYRSRSEQPAVVLPTPRPFRDFVAWLAEQDVAAAESFWRDRLAGARPVNLTAFMRGQAVNRRQGVGVGRATAVGRAGRIDLSLGSSLSSVLQRFARDNRVTLNTVFHAAWALLLATRTGVDDVLFGTTVSGRPADLPGADKTVGVFINTVPTRLRVRAGTPVRSLLRNTQDWLLDSLAFQHLGLAEIQRHSGTAAGERMFDSILAFENYPMESPVFDLGDGVGLAIREIFEDTGYPLTLVIVPRRSEIDLELFHDLDVCMPDVASAVLDELCETLTSMITHADGSVEDVVALLPRPTPPGDHAGPEVVTDVGTPADDNGPIGLFERPAARLVRALWKEVLGHEPVRAASDFFRDGGDSLAAVRLVGQLRVSFGREVAVNDVFALRTFDRLLRHLDELVNGAGEADRIAVAVENRSMSDAG